MSEFNRRAYVNWAFSDKVAIICLTLCLHFQMKIDDFKRDMTFEMTFRLLLIMIQMNVTILNWICTMYDSYSMNNFNFMRHDFFPGKSNQLLIIVETAAILRYNDSHFFFIEISVLWEDFSNYIEFFVFLVQRKIRNFIAIRFTSMDVLSKIKEHKYIYRPIWCIRIRWYVWLWITLDCSAATWFNGKSVIRNVKKRIRDKNKMLSTICQCYKCKHQFSSNDKRTILSSPNNNNNKRTNK